MALNQQNLQPLISSLTCPICKNYFHIPMMFINCSHNFCSGCIRFHLETCKTCPICGSTQTTMGLCNNRILESLIESLSLVENKSINQQMATHNQMINCPLCSKDFLSSLIQEHASQCPGPAEPALFIAPTNPKRKYLVKPCYNIMTERQIKTFLSQKEVPTTNASRTLLIKRMNNYITLYNAECDSITPTPNSILVKRVLNMEKKNILLTNTKQAHSIEKQTSEEHYRRYKSEFDSLIKSIRERKNSNRLGLSAVNTVE